MPAFTAVVAELNRQFHPDQIKDFAQRIDAFAPGKKFDVGLIAKPGSAAHRGFSSYLDQIPGSLYEALRGVIHYALSTSPPTQVTFAWTPAYDYEMTISHATCGITVLFRSRYPSDKLPPPSDKV
ncbi:MAG: hypothetical protein ABW360_07855 [Phenylobacterium sp.]